MLLGPMSPRPPHRAWLFATALVLGCVAFWTASLASSPDGAGLFGTPAAAGAREPAVAAASEPALVARVTVIPRARVFDPEAETRVSCALSLGSARVASMATILAGPPAPSGAGERPSRRLLYFDVGGRGLCRVVDLAAESGAAITAGPAVPLCGRVIDPAGAPVAAASVWAGAVDPEVGPEIATTDAEGCFSFEAVPGGHGVPLVVRASGYASYFLVLGDGVHAMPEVVVTLEPAGLLRVVASGIVDHPELAGVELRPASDQTGMKHYPFFWGDLVGAPHRLDRDGSCTIDDLPRDAFVDVVLCHPMRSTAGPRRASVQRGSVTVDAGEPMVPLRGRVVGSEGEPLPDARVECRGRAPWTPWRGWLLPVRSFLGRGCATTSDAGGGFEVGSRRHDDGSIVLRVSAPGRIALEFEWSGQADDVPDFVLPRAADGEPVLRLHFATAGRPVAVLDDEGTWQRSSEAEPLSRRLAARGIVDVRIVLADGESELVREFAQVAVLGPVDLRLDR
jgi:hypothetical protein